MFKKIASKLFGWQYIVVVDSGSANGFNTLRAKKKWGVWGAHIGDRIERTIIPDAYRWNALGKEDMASTPLDLIMQRSFGDKSYTRKGPHWAPITDGIAAQVCMMPDTEKVEEPPSHAAGTMTDLAPNKTAAEIRALNNQYAAQLQASRSMGVLRPGGAFKYDHRG